MLAASAVGTIELRSITEPIRNVNPLANYIEAQATAIDPITKTIYCNTMKCQGTACDLTELNISYDRLIVAVGATSNPFGVKGLLDNYLFKYLHIYFIISYNIFIVT
jgi:NADH dehydrogenase FAD-containing subunit